MPPSATATHVIDAVVRRIAAAVAVAGGGAALATVLLRLLLWQPLNITQALCVGLAVAASLAASMLLAGPVAFAAREPARRAAFSMDLNGKVPTRKSNPARARRSSWPVPFSHSFSSLQ